MDEDRANFQAWYVDVLKDLYPEENAGIAAFMITLPLLERYLRLVNKRSPDDELDLNCRRTLRDLLPALPSDQAASDFWAAYRNGFLHQATLSLLTKSRKGKPSRPLPAASLTHEITEPVVVNPDGSFVVHPMLFSKLVIRTIEQNFDVFAGVGTTAPPLPKVFPTATPSNGTNVQPTALSTGNKP